MLRRSFIKVVLASALAVPVPQVLAVPASIARPIHLVEIANFGCPYCRSMESMNLDIALTVSKYGGRFIFSPLTWGENVSPVKDLIYYAARNQGDSVETSVRHALFKATQDLQLPMENASQVLVYLRQELPTLAVDWDRLEKDVYASATQDTMLRAARLAVEAGVNHVPAYLYIQSGKIIGILDRSNFPSTSEFKKAVLGKYLALQEGSQ